MTFPASGAQIYHNEAGEVTGWDPPAEPEYCDICGVYHPGLCPDEEADDLDDEVKDCEDDESERLR